MKRGSFRLPSRALAPACGAAALCLWAALGAPAPAGAAVPAAPPWVAAAATSGAAGGVKVSHPGGGPGVEVSRWLAPRALDPAADRRGISRDLSDRRRGTSRDLSDRRGRSRAYGSSGASGPRDGASAPRLASISTTVPPVGQTPIDLAFTPDGTEVVIANRDSDNVTFFDTASHAVNITVPVGRFPLSLAVTPDGRYALTANGLDNTVSVIALASHSLVATVPLSGQQPYRIKVTRDSRFAVVALIGNAVVSSLSVVDLTALRETVTISTPAQGVIGGTSNVALGQSANIFTQFALTPDGSRIILPAFTQSQVVIYNRASGATVQTIQVAANPWDVDVSSDGTFLVVGHEGSIASLTRIELASGQATAFPLPGQPFFQLNRITPDRRFAIVANDRTDQAFFLDLQSGQVTSTLPYAPLAFDLVYTSDGSAALLVGYTAAVIDVGAQTVGAQLPASFTQIDWRGAAGPSPQQVAALDFTAGESVYLLAVGPQSLSILASTPTGQLPEGHAPRAVAMAPDGSAALAANEITGNLALLDPTGTTLNDLVQAGARLADVALTPDGTSAVAVDPASGNAVIFDMASASVAATLPVGGNPDGVLMAPDGHSAYVFSSTSISFVALAGAASSIVATMPGLPQIEVVSFLDATSRFALSGDGSVLAVCGGANGTLQFIDTVGRQQIANVPVGTSPLRVALTVDGKRAWVADFGSNDVSVVQLGAGGAAATVQAVLTVPQPLDLFLDPSGAWVYVVSTQPGQPAIYVIDANANTVAQVVALPTAPAFALTSARYLPLGTLFVAGVSADGAQGALVRVAAAGTSTALLDETPLPGPALDLDVSADGQTVVLSQPSLDSVEEVRFAPPAPCAPSATRLCLDGNRFQATAQWLTPQTAFGPAQTYPLTDATGLFWFFAPDNLELVVKVLDGCPVNNHFWVFAGGLTNVQVQLQLTDTQTGAARTYPNTQSTPFQPVQDTAAFPCP